MQYKIINKKKLYLTIIVDWVLKILFGSVTVFKKKENTDFNRIQKILIIRTAYLGDILMTLPILRPLKERFINSKIIFLTSKLGGQLLLNNPYVDKIMEYDPFWFYSSKKREYLKFIKYLKKESFDLIIEARGDIRDILLLLFPTRSKYKISYNVGGGGDLLTHVVPYNGLKHKVEYHLDMVRYLGCNTNAIDWNIYLTEKEKNKIAELLNMNGVHDAFISVHPGARLPLKRWPGERYAGLCDMIMEKYSFPLVLLGSREENELIEEIISKMKNKPIDLAGQTNIRGLAGILSRTTLFICNDSAPMHIAAALKTPTVAIFGPSKNIETMPYGNMNKIVEKEFPCRYRCDESSCHNKPFHACMDAIEVTDVFERFDELLKEI